MAKASIHFKPAGNFSELHNTREQQLDYNRKDLEPLNESSIEQDIPSRVKEIKSFCKETTGRKLQKNAEPIMEAVVNLNQEHTMTDLKKLAKDLKNEYGIECFQIHIHKDEGRWVKEDGRNRREENGKNYVGSKPIDPTDKWEPNLHAHMVFDWQEKEVKTAIRSIKGKKQEVSLQGRTKKLGKIDLSKIQDIVSESLKMDRGERRVNSNRERLEPLEFKYQALQQELTLMEQKKNTATERRDSLKQRIKEVRERIEESRARTKQEEFTKGITNVTRDRSYDLRDQIADTQRRIAAAKARIAAAEQERSRAEASEAKQAQISPSKERIKQLAKQGIQMDKETILAQAESLSGAIELQRQVLSHQQQEIGRLETESQGWAEQINEVEQRIRRTQTNLEYVHQEEARARERVERAKARIESEKGKK